MTTVNGDRPDHIFMALDVALRTLRADLSAAGSNPETAGRLAGLRSSQIRLVSLTPSDGLRLTDLATKIGMTKQALGEFATDLEARGLLETVREPTDKRVRILRRTPAGDRVVEVSDRAIRAMEQRWRTRIGPARWDAMKQVLTEIAETEPPLARET